jgi:hypothetical protein
VDSCENVRNVYVQLFDHTVAEPVVALAVEFSHESQELLDVIVVEEVYARHDLAVNPFVVLHKLFYHCLKFFSEKSFKSMQKYCLMDVHLYVTRDNYIPTLFIQPHTSLLKKKKLLVLRRRWLLFFFVRAGALFGAPFKVHQSRVPVFISGIIGKHEFFDLLDQLSLIICNSGGLI